MTHQGFHGSLRSFGPILRQECNNTNILFTGLPGPQYLWWNVVDIVLPPVFSSIFSIAREVINILAGVPSRLKARWDVVDLLGSPANHASVIITVLLSQRGGRDIIHVLWNRWLLIVVQELAWRSLFESEVWRHVVRLLFDWMWVRNVSADGWREVVDLRTQKEALGQLNVSRSPRNTRRTQHYCVLSGLVATCWGVINFMTI